MKKRYIMFLFMVTAYTLATRAIPLTQNETKVKVFESEHWIMADSSPLIFKVREPSGEIFIEVRSGGEIAGYQYGCVAVQNTNLIAVKKLEALRIDLTKEGPILYREFFDLAARTDCKTPTKLSIIAVDFQDGGRWSLNMSARMKK